MKIASMDGEFGDNFIFLPKPGLLQGAAPIH
jgi:hypothetical protein